MFNLTFCNVCYSRLLLFKPSPQHTTSHTSLQQSPSHISGHIKARIIIVLQVIWACWSTRGCVTGIGSPAGPPLTPGRAGQRLRLACDCSPLLGPNEGPAFHHLPQGPAPVQAQGVYSANPIKSPGKRDQREREPAGSNGHLKQQQNSSVGSLTLSCPCLGKPTRYHIPVTASHPSMPLPALYTGDFFDLWDILDALQYAHSPHARPYNSHPFCCVFYLMRYNHLHIPYVCEHFPWQSVETRPHVLYSTHGKCSKIPTYD